MSGKELRMTNGDVEDAEGLHHLADDLDEDEREALLEELEEGRE